MERISFVFPVYNEENNLVLLYEKVKEACAAAAVSYRMIFIDNGSVDNSLKIIRELRQGDPQVSYLSLSRNFGHQNALFAGLTHCNGDAVITMDADLQHPPSLIPEMVRLWREGNDVVYTFKEGKNIPWLKRVIVKIFYKLMTKISGLELHFGQSDFRLIDKKILNVILTMPEYHKFLRGQIRWAGFKQIGISFAVELRHSGESKFSFKDLFMFALDGLLGFSRYPLHVITLIGLVVGFFSLLFILKEVFLSWILDLPMPPGWASLAAAVFFLGSIQLIAIGILGEYVGRIFDQTKQRPNFIIKESSL